MISNSIIENIRVRIYEDRELLGRAATQTVAETIGRLLMNQPVVNMLFAAAPSQNEFLAGLSKEPVEWGRINAFHLDEYLGLDFLSPQSFGHFLETRLFGRVPLRSRQLLNGVATDPQAECRRYAFLLQEFPMDIGCLGIGENAHLAFNDPPVANFNDPEKVKVVLLDEDCRRQQVNDGCFAMLAAVPQKAFTLTIPALLDCRYIFAMVPGERKANAVSHTLYSPIAEKFPATVLRRHPAVQLFLDRESGSRVLFNP
jgi:glucosamine-6-phosphate deaminase